MAAATLVVTKMWEMATASRAMVDPGLKPNHPSQSTKTPSTVSAMLCPGVARGFPSAPYLPMRGPITMAPASAAQPPTACTTVEPAKSKKPLSASHPPPQIQWPMTG